MLLSTKKAIFHRNEPVIDGISLLHFVIPALYYRRIPAVDPVIAGAVFIVVIDDPAGLQVGIDRDRADIFEAAFLQIPADLIRQAVADWDRSGVMSFG